MINQASAGRTNRTNLQNLAKSTLSFKRSSARADSSSSNAGLTMSLIQCVVLSIGRSTVAVAAPGLSEVKSPLVVQHDVKGHITSSAASLKSHRDAHHCTHPDLNSRPC